MPDQAPSTDRSRTTGRRESELQALYLISQAANFTMPVDDIMELVYTQLRRVIPAPNFYIALTRSEKETLSHAFFVEKDERLYVDVAWSYDQGLTGQIVRTGTTIRTVDYLDECEARGIEPHGKPAHAWMGTPLLGQDQTIGVMVVSSFDPDTRYTQEDESFFVTVASYTASAIYRRRLHDSLEARAQQLNTLNDISEILASSLDIENVLDLVVKSAAKLLNAEAGSLLLLDDNSGDLMFRITSGPAAQHLVGLKVPAGKGIAGVAFSKNEPVIVNDAQHDERWYRSFDQNADFITRSLIAVPLNARGRTIGVLEVVNRKGERQSFDQQDIELLESFGAQAALAIENARLFTMTDQALQARVEELTTLQHIDRQLNATLDYGEVMKTTLSWAVRITGAAAGLIAALHEEEDGQPGLQFLAYDGYPAEVIERYTGEELWPLTQGILGRTVLSGETLLLTDVSQNSVNVELVPGMEAKLSIPIRRENRVIGVLALESPDPSTFTTEEVEFVTRLADHAAIAIDNARLFEQVQRANQAKTEFISFVSHEFKQPMTAMKGYTDLLMKGIGGSLNDQQQQFLNVVRSNIQRLDRLVSDLLDISRIEAGRLRLEMDNVNPVSVTEDAVQSFENAISGKEQTLTLELEPHLPRIRADRGRIVQVLTNLLSNANKYTPAGGQVVLRVRRWHTDGESYVRWDVQDSGIGMPEDEQAKLFTKFFRGSSPEVRNVKGTGLGLVISRSIVEMHDGEMMVESAPGEGSTFSFVIPSREQASPAV
ncbi:MAG: GAF domain-containing protein [Anaerolineales bacterium]